MGIICILLSIYFVILLVRVFSSWFPVPPSGPVRAVLNVVYDLTEPVLRLVRGVVPPVRMGVMGLDLSPIIVFVVIAVLRSSIC
jgi:YggT family protein